MGIIIAVLLLVWLKRSENTYWQGRIDGWMACEDMVLQRAKEHPNYTEKVWEDLVQ